MLNPQWKWKKTKHGRTYKIVHALQFDEGKSMQKTVFLLVLWALHGDINLNDHLIYRYRVLIWRNLLSCFIIIFFFFIFETSSSGIFYHHNHWALVTLLSLMLTIKIFLEFMYYVSILQTHFFSQKIVYRFIKSSNL